MACGGLGTEKLEARKCVESQISAMRFVGTLLVVRVVTLQIQYFLFRKSYQTLNINRQDC